MRIDEKALKSYDIKSIILDIAYGSRVIPRELEEDVCSDLKNIERLATNMLVMDLEPRFFDLRNIATASGLSETDAKISIRNVLHAGFCHHFPKHGYRYINTPEEFLYTVAIQLIRETSRYSDNLAEYVVRYGSGYLNEFKFLNRRIFTSVIFLVDYFEYNLNRHFRENKDSVSVDEFIDMNPGKYNFIKLSRLKKFVNEHRIAVVDYDVDTEEHNGTTTISTDIESYSEMYLDNFMDLYSEIKERDDLFEYDKENDSDIYCQDEEFNPCTH